MIFIKEKQENYENKRLKITRYYAVNYPFYTMDYNLHDEWEIMYAAYGRCKVFCIEKEA